MYRVVIVHFCEQGLNDDNHLLRGVWPLCAYRASSQTAQSLITRQYIVVFYGFWLSSFVKVFTKAYPNKYTAGTPNVFVIVEVHTKSPANLPLEWFMLFCHTKSFGKNFSCNWGVVDYIEVVKSRSNPFICGT